MKKSKKIVIIFVAIIILFTVGYLIKREISYPLVHVKYNGKVTNFQFHQKGNSEFQLDDKPEWYPMHHLDCDLKLGDSMAKKIDDEYIYHYRNGKVIGVYGVCFGRRYQ